MAEAVKLYQGIGFSALQLTRRATCKQPLPKTERQLGDDAAGIEGPPGPPQRVLRLGDARSRGRRQGHARIVIPIEAVAGRELAVKSIAQDDFEGLQRRIE